MTSMSPRSIDTEEHSSPPKPPLLSDKDRLRVALVTSTGTNGAWRWAKILELGAQFKMRVVPKSEPLVVMNRNPGIRSWLSRLAAAALGSRVSLLLQLSLDSPREEESEKSRDERGRDEDAEMFFFRGCFR